MISPAHILYEFIMPGSMCAELGLYFHLKGENSAYSRGAISLAAGESMDFLSYFNCFSCGKWQRHTNVHELAAYCELSGQCRLDLLLRDGRGITRLGSLVKNSLERESAVIALEGYPKDGILGLELHAISDCEIYGGGYASAVGILRQIKLNICVTTYKREEAVKKAVARLAPILGEDIDLTVIDNGATLRSLAPARVVAGRNLGGTGGFMHGLWLSLRQDYTHCLFMDDDASCEPGAIPRSISFLSHALDPRLAITGAMLYEDEPWRQWENGATCQVDTKSINRDLDLRLVENVWLNEIEAKDAIYGAWWFFMFPLAHAKNYAFPFFLRGDDIDFSLCNDFRIVTLNGVAAWQEDFRSKRNPAAIYFYARGLIVRNLIYGEDQKDLCRKLERYFNRFNNSCMYVDAKAVVLGLKHALMGCDFFTSNMRDDSVLKMLSQLASEETWQKLDVDESQCKRRLPCHNFKLFPKFFKKATLNGHLLPARFLRDAQNEFLLKSCTPAPDQIFLKKRLLVYDPKKGKAAVFAYDRIKYLKNRVQFYALWFKLYYFGASLARKFKSGAKKTRSDMFWSEFFK